MEHGISVLQLRFWGVQWAHQEFRIFSAIQISLSGLLSQLSLPLRGSHALSIFKSNGQAYFSISGLVYTVVIGISVSLS